MLGKRYSGILRRPFLLKHMAPGLRLCVGSALNNEFAMSTNTLAAPPGGERLVLCSSSETYSEETSRDKMALADERKSGRALPGVSCDATERRRSARLLVARRIIKFRGCSFPQLASRPKATALKSNGFYFYPHYSPFRFL